MDNGESNANRSDEGPRNDDDGEDNASTVQVDEGNVEERAGPEPDRPVLVAVRRTQSAHSAGAAASPPRESSTGAAAQSGSGSTSVGTKRQHETGAVGSEAKAARLAGQAHASGHSPSPPTSLVATPAAEATGRSTVPSPTSTLATPLPAAPAALPGALHQHAAPAALPGALHQPAAPAALPGALHQHAVPAALPGALHQLAAPAALPAARAAAPANAAPPTKMPLQEAGTLLTEAINVFNQTYALAMQLARRSLPGFTGILDISDWNPELAALDGGSDAFASIVKNTAAFESFLNTIVGIVCKCVSGRPAHHFSPVINQIRDELATHLSLSGVEMRHKVQHMYFNLFSYLRSLGPDATNYSIEWVLPRNASGSSEVVGFRPEGFPAIEAIFGFLWAARCRLCHIEPDHALSVPRGTSDTLNSLIASNKVFLHVFRPSEMLALSSEARAAGAARGTVPHTPVPLTMATGAMNNMYH